MLKAAVIKSYKRLVSATEASERLSTANKFGDFESAWTDFLVSLNSIINILEQGAKNTPQSRQWFGAKKRLGRTDPLLRYLHQARNAEEHGVDSVAWQPPSVPSIHNNTGGFVTVRVTSLNGNTHFEQICSETGAQPQFITHCGHGILVAVKDVRFGEIFVPPKERLGKIIDDPSAIGLARVALEYYEALIREADSMT